MYPLLCVAVCVAVRCCVLLCVAVCIAVCCCITPSAAACAVTTFASRAYFNQRIGDEWLSIRLDVVGASITFMAALLAV